jgi:predicted nucleic acid-binding protein
VNRRDRVFVDANELFPFSVMDLVLSLAEDLLIDFVWSEELIDEWERVIVREGKRTPETARSVSDAVRRFFVTTRIDPLAYRDRIQSVPGRDPDDRVHTAACAFGGATVLLTRNERDFPGEFLAEHGVVVRSADAYPTGLLRRRPAALLDVVTRLAARKQRPPISPCDIATSLGAAGATRLSSSLQRRLGCS